MPHNEIFSQRISKLSPSKLALLEQRRSGKSASLTQQLHISRRSPDDPAWLSSTQQRLWFLNELLPHSPAYNIPLALRLTGSLNIHVLEQSLNHIVARHDILRTTFMTAGREEPIQVIAATLHVGITVIDLVSLPERERTHQIERLAIEESLVPFDLQAGPLLRIGLLRLSEEEHIFLLTVHHIIADAWSLGLVFTRELAANYLAFLKGAPSPLPALPIQYADFASWQKRWLQESEQMQSQLAYWKQHLAGASGVLALPTDHPRPAMQSFHGASQNVEIPVTLAEALRNFSNEEGVTLFMTLMAALALLLYRYTGQTDVLVGMLIANRMFPELEPLIGFCANTLVIRTDLSGNPGVRELLKRVERETLAAYAHQDMPFEKVVEAIRPERDLSRGALVQVVFAHNNTPMQQIKLPGLVGELLTFPSRTSKTDLTVMMEDTLRGVQGYFEYNTDLFEATTMKRMVEHFQVLLQSMVSQPDQPIGSLPLLTAQEEALMLGVWNTTATGEDARHVTPFMEQFTAQVRRTPDAVAIQADSQHLSYSRLELQAARLARRLRLIGVGTDALVGLFLSRSVESLIAILAVFQAGGAYVPLDPNYPEQRLNYMLADAPMTALLTTSSLRASLPSTTLPVLLVEDEVVEGDVAPARQGRGGLHSTQAPTNTTQEQCAYVIYTSGSTGRPKGVMIRQQGMLNHLRAKIDSLQLRASDRLAQTASMNFDISVWQWLAPLLVGGQVILVPDEQVLDPLELLAVVHTYSISVLEVVPSLLRALLEVLELPEKTSEAARSLRWLLATGEALPAELAARWQGMVTWAPLVNAYGPTECSDDVSQEVVGQIEQRDHEWGTIPIGRALANTQLYILDKQMQPVPIGVPGELYVGGRGVGRGYLNDPERTAQAFVPDPFGASLGGRLYRTGDLTRYREDGRLEYLDRVDQQVKIRGFRLELGEIEAVLRQHESIRACAVTVRKGAPGEKQLVGYVVARNPGQELAFSELRAYLRERLPDYMVPTGWMQLEDLPLTPNGKIDRQGLPTLDRAQMGKETGYMPPRTELEEQLVEIWEQVLGVERVGVQDNFFDLGGHSLKATQVMARVQQALGVNVPLRNLFGDPTVAGLASALEQAQEYARQTPQLSNQSRERGEQHLEDLLDYLEGLSEQEIQALLDKNGSVADINL